MSISERTLLCEGREGAFLPSSVYCKQNDKVWFAYGRSSSTLSESAGMQVVESIDALDLEERTLPNGRTIKLPKDGVWVVEGPSQQSDKRNANQRSYPRAIWEKWIANKQSAAQVAIKERAMIGHLEHPKDGRTDGNLGAMVVTEATLRDDGSVWCKFELLDTEQGLRLQEYTRKGIKWGVSSRGNGTVDESGRVNPDDYVLETWDAVMRPSVAGSHPQLASESDEGSPAPSPANSVSEQAEETVGLSQDAVRLVSVVEDLCSQSIDDMTPTERIELSTQIRTAMRGLRPHLSLMHERVQKAAQGAYWKTVAIQETGANNIDEIIEGACHDASESGGDAAEAYQNLIEEFRSRLHRTASEAEQLREALEVAESRCLTSNWRVQELTEQLASACDSLAFVRQLLAERPAWEASGQVLDAVDEAVGQDPNLEPFRELLERVEETEQVAELAELLSSALRQPVREAVEEIVTEDEVSPEDESRSRLMLPRGAVVSERDIEPTPVRDPLSRGASLAAKVMSLTEKKS